MKIFKRIYYPLMAVLFIVLITLSFVSTVSGNKKNSLGSEFISNAKLHLAEISSASHNSVYTDKQERVANYITSQLSAAGVKLGSSYIDDEETVYEYKLNDAGKPVASYVVQRDTLTEETLKLIDEYRDDDLAVWEVDKTVSNIVVYIPGTTTLGDSGAEADVVMMIAHYDTRLEGAGASDNGSQVAAMLENIISIVKNGSSHTNDLLFVFTDAKEEGMYGAFAFKNQFNGFSDVYSRVGLGVNFDALGNKGTLALIDSSNNNYDLISAYGKIGRNTFASSFVSLIYGDAISSSDFNIFDEIPSLSFANVGGGDVLHTSHDTADNVAQSTIIQHANMMNDVIKTFGSFDLSKLESGSDAVFFSVLDAFTIVYSYAVSYIFGAIIILLAVGIVVLNRKNKVFSWTRTGSGAVVQLLSIVGSVIALFVLYYLIGLLVSAMGIIPIRAIGRLTQQSVGLIISFMLLSVVSSAFLSIVFRRLFNVNSTDITRGNVLIFGVIGAILAFATPKYAYFFAITAMLELLTLLIVTIFSNKFKSKFGMPMGKLFPYTWPLIVAIPLIIPIITLAGMSLSTMFLPLLMILFMLLTGFITPYCVLFTPMMDKLFTGIRLTRRVETEVTETIEDKAKKGKFVEKTSIKIVKEKYSVKYRHAYSAVFFAVIFAIMATVFSSVGFEAGRRYVSFGGYRDAVYNSSMVLVWEKLDDSSASTFLQVDDLNAYKFIGEAIGGFSWSFDKDAYVKNVYSVSSILGSSPTITINEDNEYEFKLFSPERSLVSLRLTDTDKITKLIIKSNDGDVYEYENSDSLDSILINIPYKFGNFTLAIEGDDNISVEYNEIIMDIGSSIANLAELEEWKDVMSFYADREDVTSRINSGIVFRIVKNRF